MTDHIKISDRKYLSEKYDELDHRKRIDDDELENMYDEWLDGLGEVTMGKMSDGNYSFDPSRLKEVDPIAYRGGFSDDFMESQRDYLFENYIIEDENDSDEDLIEWRKENL